MKAFLRRRWTIILFFGCAILLGQALPAAAMHISEGILPFPWAFLWFCVAAPFVALGLRQLKRSSAADLSFKPLTGFMAAVVFIISCVPVPVPIVGVCAHPCGTAISGILLGPAVSVIVAAVALLIQALFLAHGGLSTLGANLVSMGIAGSFTGFFVFRLLTALGARLPVAGFVAGVVADWCTYLTTALIMALGLKGSAPLAPLFLKITAAFVPTQLPLGFLEGAITAGMLVLLARKRPDLLLKMKVLKAREAVQ